MRSRMTEGLLSFLRHNTIALIALFLALGGTAWAATALPANSVGTKQLKKNAVTSAKVKNDTIKGADVLESSLAKVPSAASADTATNATHATSADNATTVGGIGATVFGTTAKYAGVDFRPLLSTTPFTTAASGSISTPGAAFFAAHLSLPQGAKATKLTIYVDNTVALASGTLGLYRFDLMGAVVLVKFVPGGNAVGRSSASADIAPAEVIDNTKYVYELVWLSPGNPNGLGGAQVDYTLP